MENSVNSTDDRSGCNLHPNGGPQNYGHFRRFVGKLFAELSMNFALFSLGAREKFNYQSGYNETHLADADADAERNNSTHISSWLFLLRGALFFARGCNRDFTIY